MRSNGLQVAALANTAAGASASKACSTRDSQQWVSVCSGEFQRELGPKRAAWKWPKRENADLVLPHGPRPAQQSWVFCCCDSQRHRDAAPCEIEVDAAHLMMGATTMPRSLPGLQVLVGPVSLNPLWEQGGSGSWHAMVHHQAAQLAQAPSAQGATSRKPRDQKRADRQRACHDGLKLVLEGHAACEGLNVAIITRIGHGRDTFSSQSTRSGSTSAGEK